MRLYLGAAVLPVSAFGLGPPRPYAAVAAGPGGIRASSGTIFPVLPNARQKKSIQSGFFIAPIAKLNANQDAFSPILLSSAKFNFLLGAPAAEVSFCKSTL